METRIVKSRAPHGYVKRPTIIHAAVVYSVVVVVASHAGRTRVHLAHVDHAGSVADPATAKLRDETNVKRKLARDAERDAQMKRMHARVFSAYAQSKVVAAGKRAPR